jgi:hypothetical protein
VLVFVGWAAFEGAAKLAITNAAEIAMFVFMNKKIASRTQEYLVNS